MKPLPLIQPLPWMQHARCTPRNADLFFPNTAAKYGDRLEAAKHMCGGCPVNTECLAHALDLHPVEGIWAGSTPSERDALRRKARR